MKISKKLLTTATIMSLTLVTLTGCKNKDPLSYEEMDKEQLVEELYAMDNKYDTIFKENEKYKDMLKVLDSSGSTAPSISVMNDGSGHLTFNTYDSKMIFPNTFVYPGTVEISANTKIVLADQFSISPTNGWITKLNGASLELEHSSGISGLIKVGSIDELYVTGSFREDILQPWFKDISTDTVVYSDIFVNNKMWGGQAKAPIYIDEELAYLKAGMYGLGKYSVQYVFVYRGANDPGKDELVDSLLNTMELLNLDVSVN